MEAAFSQNSLFPVLSFNEATSAFFADKTPQYVNLFFWRIFQCWVTKDCTLKEQMSDEEVAQVLDQLNLLVIAAYKEYYIDGDRGETVKEGPTDD